MSIQLPAPAGPCSLGDMCQASTQAIIEKHKCRKCARQLHGSASGCSRALDPNNLQLGVICIGQPCNPAEKWNPSTCQLQGHALQESVKRVVDAGLPEYLWETQKSNRLRDPAAPRQKRQRYSKEMKDSLLNALDQPGASFFDVSKQSNVPVGTLRGWKDEETKNSAPVNVVGNNDQPPLFETERPTAAAAAAPTNSTGSTVQSNTLNKGNDQADHSVNNAGQQSVPPNRQTGGEKEPPTKKIKHRKRYSNDLKIQVLLALKARPGTTIAEVSKQFNIPPGTVRGFRNEAEKIHRHANEQRRSSAKANPSRDPLQRIWDAILNLREKNSRLPKCDKLDINISVVQTIGTQARDALLGAHKKQPFLNHAEVAGFKKFKASETWARKWAGDFNTVASRKDQQNMRAGYARVNNEAAAVTAALQRTTEINQIISQFSPGKVYTVSKSMLFYKVLPNRTYVAKQGGELVRAAKGLKSQDLFSLYVCANESGTHKVPLTCIGKSENPVCFRAKSQQLCTYLSHPKALPNTVTFQKWWRTIFLPAMRDRYPSFEDKVLLLVESADPFRVDFLRDPMQQVRIEVLPNGIPSMDPLVAGTLRDYRPLDLGIVDSIKRNYRYRLLREVMEIYPERSYRHQVAMKAGVEEKQFGLWEGQVANARDAMRILKRVWDEVDPETIRRCWEATNLRPKHGDESANSLSALQTQAEGKKLLIKEKRNITKDVASFLQESKSDDSPLETEADSLKEAVDKLKACFVSDYINITNPEAKDIGEGVERWTRLESSADMKELAVQELKSELNIEYLVGLREPLEAVLPEADEKEEKEKPWGQVPPSSPNKLDLSTAVALASTIKETASKLFQYGDLLGSLAMQLDGASNEIFRLFRSQTEAASNGLDEPGKGERKRTDLDEPAPFNSPVRHIQQF